MEKKHLALFILVVTIASVLIMKEDVLSIPYYIFRSLFRMISAYGLTLVFSLSFGLLMAHNKRAFKILFPVMDVIQSIPILGFVPFAMLFLIALFPEFGTEVVGIFLIFTSMTWAVLFNVIEGIKTIPDRIKDVAKLTNLNGVDYLFHVAIPAVYAPLISGTITGWGGAWYFLVVGEYLTFANKIYSLDGIGSFISQSAYAGNIVYSLLGIGILAAVVLSINKFIWQPLLFKARRYSYGMQETQVGEESEVVYELEKLYDERIKKPAINWKPLRKIVGKVFSFFGIGPESRVGKEKTISLSFLFLFFFIAGWLAFSLVSETSELIDVYTLGIAAGATVLRIIIAYVLALTWTLGAALLIARNKKLLKYLMPLFDVGMSVPAVAIFPIIVVIVINWFGGGIGIEIASILLIMTGTQWYLLFNLIRAIGAIPMEIIDLSRVLSLNRINQVKEVIIPAIVPAIIIGSVEAIGGGLNATIISEYIIYKDQVFSTMGLGYLMSAGAVIGDNTAIIISVITMMLIVLVVNKFIWKRMLGSIEKYKFGV